MNDVNSICGNRISTYPERHRSQLRVCGQRQLQVVLRKTLSRRLEDRDPFCRACHLVSRHDRNRSFVPFPPDRAHLAP